MNEPEKPDTSIDRDKILAAVRRLIPLAANGPASLASATSPTSPAAASLQRRASYRGGLERLLNEVRTTSARVTDDKARAVEEVDRLLHRHPISRYAALVARPELSRPAVAELLLKRTRGAIAEGSGEAVELARLAAGAACRFSGAQHGANLTIAYLGEAWLLLALAQLAGQQQAEALEAFHVATALLVRCEVGVGDANVAAEFLVVEGLLEYAAGNVEPALLSFQEAVGAYAALDELARARAAARLLAEANLLRRWLESPGPRPVPYDLDERQRRATVRPLSHLFAVWRVLTLGELWPFPEDAA